MVYALRRRWRDSRTAVVFELLDFISRPASLVPRPRAHLVIDHGVLAPAAEWRDRIVPAESVRKSPSLSASKVPSLHGSVSLTYSTDPSS